ncbi:MAG: tRNA preQ1(34) S-adenosylmethionine ribosyltransferase-isomerase QueA [Acidobacteria bacterium]|nr:tRNA preQ1(34) S-adenosylmethionine ribosyltransferase-isomerase QueA [Acidobacteriota bacterium]
MKIDEFDFELPERCIAQHPVAHRDQSKMMVVWKKTGKREHHIFRDMPDILNQEHFLVRNNTRVFPARLKAKRPGKVEEIEVLLLREHRQGEWSALTKPARKTPVGQELIIGHLTARVLEVTESGSRILHFDPQPDLMAHIERIGEPPLPPYIHRSEKHDFSEDKIRYQTVYACERGSIAAPTAGLHFTPEIFSRLYEKRIPVCEIMLHVGYGTFQPVRCENVEEHRMESEYYRVEAGTLSRIRRYKAEGRRLIAVGTTTTRCLEFLASDGKLPETTSEGECNLFIYPGFEFKILDGLLTNFHLPKSTLFMLVSAFAGRDLMLDCYHEAISRDYRFFSYGDCMLII